MLSFSNGCPPAVIEAGSTVEFSTPGSYPAATWSMQFALNNGIAAPLVIAATEVGATYKVTITAAQTNGLSPGSYTWGEVYTLQSDTTVKKPGRTGTLEVIPGILTQGTPTAAQIMVTKLEETITKLSSQQFTSTSFNGQSYTRSDIGSLQGQLAYWRARVAQEKARLDSLRGNGRSSLIYPAFVPMGGGTWPCCK